MTKRSSLLILLILSLFALAACSPAQTAVPQPMEMEETAAPMPDESDEPEMAAESHEGEDMDAAGEEPAMDDQDGDTMGEAEHDGEQEMDDSAGDMEMEDGESMADASEAGAMESPAAMRPAWQELALVDATTGETFTLGGFAGKTVFVEPMATWCTNCRQQLGNVAQARSQLGDDVVFVALSLETTLDPAELAQYQQTNGFDWTFAVMSAELLGQLADEFGRSITSAPSTPHFIIRPDGTFTELSTGINDPQALIAMIRDAQS